MIYRRQHDCTIVMGNANLWTASEGVLNWPSRNKKICQKYYNIVWFLMRPHEITRLEL